MKPPPPEVFTILEKYPLKMIAHRWPAKSVVRYIEKKRYRKLAEMLIADVEALSQEGSTAKYAQTTNGLLLKQQRAATKLRVEIKNILLKKHPLTRGSVESLRKRYDGISDEMAQLLERDQRWGELASRLHEQRRALSQEVSRWAPKWQRPMAAVLSEVDSALRYAPRATKTEAELQRAVQRIHRVCQELDWVKGVAAHHAASTKTSIRVDAIQPTSESYFQRDLSNYRSTLVAGRSCFAAGEYAAASRHLGAARDIALQILVTERVNRRKNRADAGQWLTILANDNGAQSLSQEISAVLEDSSRPAFLAEWESLHERIDGHVAARACEMGNRDQKVIAKGLKARQIMQWKQELDTEELTRFARVVAKKL